MPLAPQNIIQSLSPNVANKDGGEIHFGCNIPLGFSGSVADEDQGKKLH